jgi:hypothetical protein
LKYVGRLFGAGGSGFAASVAKDRDVEEAEMKVRDTWRRGGAFRHLNLLAVAAIITI